MPFGGCLAAAALVCIFWELSQSTALSFALLQDEDEFPGGTGEEDGKRKRSLYAEVTDVGLARGTSQPPAAAVGDWDAAADAAITAAAKAKDQQKDLGETLPPWVVRSSAASPSTAWDRLVPGPHAVRSLGILSACLWCQLMANLCLLHR